ncbi:hypothetical protein Misp01_63990 [Microtetraspora sp. NBRC 13810]|uniref:CHRD domain-containing protein n=1 Tax=Microtetraspora sp. NBRC 13810 TaxID=3030990 RepID=UPI0024A22300|nr:CHRD domain-containing protein [Microtetraspora sp. NBRC 13810]GLW11271.1 hypothetical protein Misp01_63990 [Microtetraspora sp. NBRC 13810]
MDASKQAGRTTGRGRVAARLTVGAAAALLALGAAALPAGAATATTAGTAATTASATTATAKSYYFATVLLGRNEVREAGKKVNDRDGLAVAKFRIVGNRMYYLVQWKRVAKPSAFHIHRGKAGTNGAVVIDLLSHGKTRGNTSTGSVVVKDTSVLNGIKSNPKNWYANLHTKPFPDGAVRGQLAKGGRW